VEREINFLAKQHRSGLLLVGTISVLAFWLSEQLEVISPLTIGLLAALALSNFVKLSDRFDSGALIASKFLMRAGIVLLGLRISFDQIAEIGFNGLLLVILVVVLTFFGALALGKLLKLSQHASILIGAGFAICGNTAIAAISPTINAKREETAYAVGLVTMFGTISIAVLPLAGSILNLSEVRFGAWAGAAVHDVGQVVATAEVIGGAALATAVIVKLTRMLMLAPMLIALTVKFGNAANVGVKKLVPFFILAFLAVVTVNSLTSLPDAAISIGKTASTLLLTAGITGMGLGVKWRSLQNLGGKPLLLASIAWIIVAVGSLILIVLLNVA
jgi:uncharacterized integral membrane protein (TIGR00698 family)